MTRLFLILIMATQLGCAGVLETAVGSFIGGLAVEVVKEKMDEAEKDEAPNVPADGTVGMDSDDNLYILKP